MFHLVFTSVNLGLTSSVNIGSQTGLPCSSYTTIDDPSRNINQVGNGRPCDKGAIFNTTSGKAWIRFVGSGGTIMATTGAGIGRCGAFFTVWYNSSLPTIPGTTTNGTGCLDDSSTKCMISISIDVELCSGSPNFYIYRLPPVPVCNSRYCTT